MVLVHDKYFAHARLIAAVAGGRGENVVDSGLHTLELKVIQIPLYRPAFGPPEFPHNRASRIGYLHQRVSGSPSIVTHP